MAVPYHLLVIEHGVRRAYDARGVLVDETTGQPIRQDVDPDAHPPKRRPGRPRKLKE